jgi:anti-anti-sigma regulatory factor
VFWNLAMPAGYGRFAAGKQQNEGRTGKRRSEEQDVPVTLEQKDALSLIRLEGAIDVGCAAELKELLMEKLKSGAAVYVALESATGLDVTAVQLLWAAAREAQQVGVEFGFKGQMPEGVRCALADAGMGEFPVPAATG